MSWASEDLGAWVGRRFVGISRADALAEPSFRLTGVGVLATRGIIHESLATIGPSFEQIQLYEPLEEPLLFGRSAEFERDELGITVDPRRIHGKGIEELPSEDSDTRAFELTPRGKDTVLFCSMQYHPHWRAIGTSEQGERRALETARLNELYFGVLVPAGISSVTLHFEPWVRWMGLSKLAVALLGAGLLALRLREAGRG